MTEYSLSLSGLVLFTSAIFLEIKWMVYLTSIFFGYFFKYFLIKKKLNESMNFLQNIYNGMPCFKIWISYRVHLSRKWTANCWAFEYREQCLWSHSCSYLILRNVHLGLFFALLLGLILTINTKDEQRRQNAYKSATYQQVFLNE